MSQYEPRTMSDQYTAGAAIASEASADTRVAFLKKTYLHLFGAIVVFVALVAGIQSMPGVDGMVQFMSTGWNWLFVLGAFIAVSYFAERMARNAASLSTQYLGLGLYVVAMAVLSTPLIFIARMFQANLATDANPGGPPIILAAAGGTLAIFAALTGIVLLTKKDFSFLRSALYMLGFIAIGLIVCSIIFGFDLGIIFTVAMIGFASLWILYDTSNVLHHYHTGQYVSASLALFASVILLFWYILRFAMYIYESVSGD